MATDGSPYAHDLDAPTSPQRRSVLQAALAGSMLGPLAACGDSGSDSGPIDYSATIRDGRAAIIQAMADTDTSSVSVALADGSRLVWQQAFGTIDDANGQPAGINTLYNIGSVSKVFAALAVMILVDRRLVDLDAPASTYVHDFQMLSPEFANVTVRMLLSHTSGFPGANYNNIFSFQPLPGYARKTQTVLAGEHLKHTPGELAVYCNDGFTMAERVVEEVSGKSYAVFVTQEILGPLGMSLSRYPLAPYPAGSFAHARFKGADQSQEFVNAYGTGGLSSTPTEMMNLAMMFLQGGEFNGRRILSREAVAEMGRDQTTGTMLNPTPQWKWGLGWDQTDHPGLRAVGFTCWEKNGGTTFFGSDLFVMPDTGLAVMITGTTSAYGAGRLAERILLHALVDKRLLPQLPPPLPAAPPPAVTADDAVLDAITGYYGSFEGVSRVDKNGDRSMTLFRHEAGAWTTVAAGLRLRDDGWFSTEGSPRSFRLVDSGPYRYLIMRFTNIDGHYRNSMPYGQQITAAPALSASWQGRLGKSWVLINEHESSTMLNVDSPRVTLTEIAELPGYVQIDGRQPLLPDTNLRTHQFLKIPVNFGRDLYELVVRMQGAEEWLALGGYFYRPLDSIPQQAGPGGLDVPIGADGYSECVKLSGANTLAVTGARAWRLYDDGWNVLEFKEGDGSASLPTGTDAFVMIHGEPASLARATLA
ncbi:serine hydrolase domain-containing protein [Castellaniella sp. GW247-6E4]|uniref:serine hydrolase domain-containing protein n=1 Tax=Castellaniella sp. GW247-6E4 TaxID=3140380 RepID=UPI0033149BF5